MRPAVKRRPFKTVDENNSNPLRYAEHERRVFEPRFAIYAAGWVLIALLAGYFAMTIFGSL